MISVAMCTYNGEKFIKDQIQSILNQTVSVDELIICDDGSTDSTTQIIRDLINNTFYTNTEIILIVNTENKGVTKNFEKALSMCNGDIVFLSDQDDIWIEDKVERILDVFNNNSECKLVFTDAFLIDTQGDYLKESLWDLIQFAPKNQYTVLDFLGDRFVTGATAAVRRGLIADVIPIPESWIHDAWLAINAAVRGDIIAMNRKLICYRQHSANVIGAKRRSLPEQILFTFSHLQKSCAFRTIMKNRFQDFLDRNKELLSDNETDKIKECIDFWRESESIQKKPLLAGLAIILRNMCNGKYKEYSNGLRGALVDLAISFSRKRLSG